MERWVGEGDFCRYLTEVVAPVGAEGVGLADAVWLDWMRMGDGSVRLVADLGFLRMGGRLVFDLGCCHVLHRGEGIWLARTVRRWFGQYEATAGSEDEARAVLMQAAESQFVNYFWPDSVLRARAGRRGGGVAVAV